MNLRHLTSCYPLFVVMKCRRALWKLTVLPVKEISEIYLRWVALLFYVVLNIQSNQLAVYIYFYIHLC